MKRKKKQNFDTISKRERTVVKNEKNKKKNQKNFISFPNILIKWYEFFGFCCVLAGSRGRRDREDDDVPALRSRTEWEPTGAALKTYAAVGTNSMVVTAAAAIARLWRPATRRARRRGGLYPQLSRAGALRGTKKNRPKTKNRGPGGGGVRYRRAAICPSVLAVGAGGRRRPRPPAAAEAPPCSALRPEQSRARRSVPT